MRADQTDNTTHSRKRTQFMCHQMLVWLQTDIRFRPGDMYVSLGIPRRTYQDYATGVRSIPAGVAGAARDIHRRNRVLMDRWLTVEPPPTGLLPTEMLRQQQQKEYENGIVRV